MNPQLNAILDELKSKIEKFALKYDFIQQSDIDKIEHNEKPFVKKDYDLIHNKYFIGLIERKEEIFVEIGKIQVEVDTLDEEDYYSIDKNILFSLPFFPEFPELITIEELVEMIKIKCNEFNII